MKTFNVEWLERNSVNVEAETAEEACSKVLNCEYDEEGVSAEIAGAPDAYEVTTK